MFLQTVAALRNISSPLILTAQKPVWASHVSKEVYALKQSTKERQRMRSQRQE